MKKFWNVKGAQCARLWSVKVAQFARLWSMIVTGFCENWECESDLSLRELGGWK